MEAIGAIIAAIVGVVGSVLLSRSQTAESRQNALEVQDKQQEFDKSMAQYQNQVTLDQWSRQNAYDNPSAQMQRLVGAGLNKDLLYGGLSQGSTSGSFTSAQSSAPVYQSPADVSSLSSLGGNVVNALTYGQQQKLIDSQIQLNQANAIKAEGKDAYSQSQIRLADANIQLIGEQLGYTKSQTEYVQRQVDFIKEQTKKVKTEIDLLEQQMVHNLKMYPAEELKAKMDALIAQIDEQYHSDEVRSRIRLLKQDILESKARVDNLNASTNNLDASTRDIESQKAVHDALSRLYGWQAERESLQFTFDEKYGETKRKLDNERIETEIDYMLSGGLLRIFDTNPQPTPRMPKGFRGMKLAGM